VIKLPGVTDKTIQKTSIVVHCLLLGNFLFNFMCSGFLCAEVGYNIPYPFGDTAIAEEIVPLQDVEPEEEYQPHSADLYKGNIEERPPEDFKVVAVESKDVATKPEASTLSTHKLFVDPTVFEHVDTHALEVCLITFLLSLLWHIVGNIQLLILVFPV